MFTGREHGQNCEGAASRDLAALCCHSQPSIVAANHGLLHGVLHGVLLGVLRGGGSPRSVRQGILSVVIEWGLSC